MVAPSPPDRAASTVNGPPPLEPTVSEFVADSNASIGQDWTEHLNRYATTECATEMKKLGSTNTSSPTRLVRVTQDGPSGTSTTALRDDPSDEGSTLHWEYSDRWRFTCDGIFR